MSAIASQKRFVSLPTFSPSLIKVISCERKIVHIKREAVSYALRRSRSACHEALCADQGPTLSLYTMALMGHTTAAVPAPKASIS